MTDHDVHHLSRILPADDVGQDPMDRDLMRLDRRISRLEGEMKVLISVSIAQTSAILALAVALIAHAI
jgi:hypothetical protein